MMDTSLLPVKTWLAAAAASRIALGPEVDDESVPSLAQRNDVTFRPDNTEIIAASRCHLGHQHERSTSRLPRVSRSSSVCQANLELPLSVVADPLQHQLHLGDGLNFTKLQALVGRTFSAAPVSHQSRRSLPPAVLHDLENGFVGLRSQWASQTSHSSGLEVRFFLLGSFGLSWLTSWSRFLWHSRLCRSGVRSWCTVPALLELHLESVCTSSSWPSTCSASPSSSCTCSSWTSFSPTWVTIRLLKSTLVLGCSMWRSAMSAIIFFNAARRAPSS